MNSVWKKTLKTLAAAAFWIGLWWVVSLVYGMDFILPSPVTTLRELIKNIADASFWASVLWSTSKILCGFLLSVFLGFLLSVLGIRFKFIRLLFDPFCSVIRAVPVASFIILVLVTFSSKNVSLVISFLMAFPVVYSTLVGGTDAANEKLLEAARVFKMGFIRKLRFIYLPELKPFLTSALSVGCGLAFKSGIAAEVIGYPKGSVGEAMYLSKVAFDMPLMLSYTVVIVIVSVCIEKAIKLLLGKGAGYEK